MSEKSGKGHGDVSFRTVRILYAAGSGIIKDGEETPDSVFPPSKYYQEVNQDGSK